MKLYIGSYFAFFTTDHKHWVEMDLPSPTPLAEILSELGIPISELHLVVVNDELQESIDTCIANDDVVRLYPAVGGG